jgi:hypothetical protein
VQLKVNKLLSRAGTTNKQQKMKKDFSYQVQKMENLFLLNKNSQTLEGIYMKKNIQRRMSPFRAGINELLKFCVCVCVFGGFDLRNLGNLGNSLNLHRVDLHNHLTDLLQTGMGDSPTIYPDDIQVSEHFL